MVTVSRCLARKRVPALSLILCLIFAFNARPAQAATATVDVLEVNAGSKLIVHGSGFSANEIIVSWVTSPHNTVYPTEQGRADDHGNIELEVSIRRFFEPGWWNVVLHGDSSKRYGVATYIVQSVPADGRLDVDPLMVRPGSRVNFHGAGFEKDEALSRWTTGPDGRTFGVTSKIQRREGEI